MPGAEVLHGRPKRISRRKAPRTRKGVFGLPYLKVGPYEVVIKQQGFADVTRRLTLTVGAAFELPVSLKVEAVSESVTVSGQAPILEAARSQIAVRSRRRKSRTCR